MAAVMMSPATPSGTGNVLGTPSSLFVSPSTRKQIGITSPSPLLNTTNQDEKERRDRRRSKVLELQRKNLGSPGTPSDRLNSTPLSGLTSNQLSDHYSNCIKLSTENKINSKNAFGLHLIDYMTELLKRKELENFQVASSTLDASAKIYAGRVDAVHAETYKVLSGLGRGAEQQDDGEEMDNENSEGVEEQEKKKKRVRNSKTIETNLKNISLNKFDLEFEVDPLFQVMSAAFDEGGTGGLLMNQLRCLDDSSALVFDSSTVMIGADATQNSDQSKKIMDLTEIKDIFRGVDLSMLQVCQAFADFRFTEWDHSSQDFLGNRLASSSHAFDVNAESEPLPADTEDDLDHGGSLMGGEDYADLGDADLSDNEDVHTDFHGGRNKEHIFVKDGAEATLVEKTLNSLRSGTVGSLIQVLAAEPSDYSYFNTNLLNTWAGPSHWKLRPLSKDPKNSANVEKPQRKKKPPFKINYDEEVEFDKHFKQSKAKTLTKATLKKYESSRTTLPKDLHYDVDKLFRLFNKPKIMIKRQSTTAESLDGGIENYDYENANDRENYCPADGICNDDDDDDHCEGGGFNFTGGAGELSQLSSQDLFASHDNSSALHSISDLNGTLNGTLLSGDNLVAQPHTVAKIEIGYAKTAKTMDVKKLKSAIWNILTTESGENKENEGEDKNEEKSSELLKLSSVIGIHSFQDLLNTLPHKISKNAAKNLSVPIAFVCLLHLANEKTLKILDEAMTDLKIEQDSN